MLPNNPHSSPWNSIKSSQSSTNTTTIINGDVTSSCDVLIHQGIDHDDFCSHVDKHLRHLKHKDTKSFQSDSIAFNDYDYNLLHFILTQQSFIQCKNLMVLELNNCSINTEGCYKIFETFAQLSTFTLQRLIMDNNPINDEGMQYILQTLLSISSNTKKNRFDSYQVGTDLFNPDTNNSLIYLSFDNCNFGFMPETWSLWIDIMNKCINLKQVNVKNNFFHPNCIKQILNELPTFKALESFEIAGNRLSYLNSLKFVLNVPQNLTRMNIGNCDMNHPSFIDSEPDLTLPQFELSLPKSCTTQRAHHWCCNVHNQMDDEEKKTVSCIQHLYFGDNVKLFERMKYFEHFCGWIHVYCPSLVLLDLSNCGLRYQQVSMLSKYLVFKPGLKFLNLSFNGIDDECVSCLCHMIQRQVLMLNNQWIESVNQLLIDAFQSKKSDVLIQNLLNIIKGYCYFDMNDIMEDRGLIGLDLCGNNITNKGAVTLFETISENIPKYRQFMLDLTGNIMTDKIVNKLETKTHNKFSIIF